MNAQNKINRNIEKQILFHMGLKKWPKPTDLIKQISGLQTAGLASQGLVEGGPAPERVNEGEGKEA